MPKKEAVVIPESADFAAVFPLPGESQDAVERVRLKTVTPGAYTIQKAEYPQGVVLLPPTPLDDNYIVLPLEICGQEEEDVEVGEPSCPNGVVVLFKSDQ